MANRVHILTMDCYCLNVNHGKKRIRQALGNINLQNYPLTVIPYILKRILETLHTIPPRSLSPHPSESHLKLKLHKITIVHSIHFSQLLIMAFCTAHDCLHHALCKISKRWDYWEIHICNCARLNWRFFFGGGIYYITRSRGYSAYSTKLNCIIFYHTLSSENITDFKQNEAKWSQVAISCVYTVL